MKAVAGVAFLLLVVSGCGDGEPASKVTPTGAPTTAPATTPAPSSSAPATKFTAAALAAKLKAGLPSVKKVVQITEENDSNNLLGRPNGYLDAAVLHDSTLSCDKPGVDCGATIEIWPTAKGAEDRAAYIQKQLKDHPMLGAEYDYTNDTALLRISGKIKPSLATKHNALFGGTLYTP